MADNYWSQKLRNRQSRRRFLGAAGLAGAGTASLALVGCGDDDDGDASPTASGGTQAAGSPTAAAGPKQGGTLHAHTSGDPPTLYPYENITFNVQRQSAYHYSRLLRGATGPDIGPTAFTKIEGDMAASLPEQPSNLEYVFKIKPNVFFHDKAPMNGRRATAQDIAATYEAFTAVAINASRFKQVVDKLEAPDENTIKITLKEPNAPFMLVGAASDQGFWFIPVETINNDQVKTDPVGTGPWKFKTWQTGARMSWERHDKWFDGPRPYIEKLDLAFMNDPNRILAALQAGELDQGDVGTDQISTARQIDPNGVTITPNSSIVTVMFNFDSGQWADKRLRQALSMSMDRAGLIASVDKTGTNPWNSFMGPALVPYYLDPQKPEFGPNSKYFKRDLAEAKKLLNAVTGSDSLDLTMVSNVDRYGATAQQLWEATAANVKEGGFKAQNSYQEYGAYIQSSYFGKLTDPKAITLGHLFGTVLDPDDLFMACYWSGSSRHNWSGQKIAEMDKLDQMFLKQRTLLNLEERTKYIHDIQREMAESMLVIPVVNWPTAVFINSWAKDAYYKATYAQIMETYSKAYFTDQRLAKG